MLFRSGVICISEVIDISPKNLTGEGNGKPLQYSCLEIPMNSMKRTRFIIALLLLNNIRGLSGGFPDSSVGKESTYNAGDLGMYLFAFSYCSWGSSGKNTEVLCHSLSSGQRFVRPLHHDLPILGGPSGHGLVSLS